MARQKVTAEPVLNNYTEVDNAMREWAGLDAQVEDIAAKQQKAIDELKAKFEKEAEPLIARKVRLEKDLQEYCEFYKEAHFSRQKSRKLTFGTLGFRASKSLKYLKGFKVRDVIAKLKELGRTEYVEEKPQLKRNDIRKDLINGKLEEASAKMFGCALDEKDEFFFEPDKAAVANAIGKLEVVRKSA